MFRTTARIATAALLALTISACSSDDDESDEPATSGPASDAAAMTPEQVEEQLDEVVCDETELILTWQSGKRKGETIDLSEAVAQVEDGGGTYRIWASDEELNTNPLPYGMPLAGESAAIATLEVHVVADQGKSSDGAIERGRVEWTDDPTKLGFHVAAKHGKRSSTSFVGAEGAVLVPAPTAEMGEPLCVSIEYSDADKSLNGTFVAEVAAVKE